MSALHPVIEDLRARNPALFTAPDFWRAGLEDIAAAAAGIHQGEAQCLGKSAGENPIWSFSYGRYEPMAPTATISSAMASDRPAAFYDASRRTAPSLTLIGSIHGGEAEGVAFTLSLIHLLETGVDSMGKSRPLLLEKIAKTRLTLVPCLNPDGRQAAGVLHLSGAELEELFLVQQGLLSDGTPFAGRKVKETQPVPPESMRFLGGYYNSKGVNLQHDDFHGPSLSPENGAIQKLFRSEVPDAFLTMHAHGGPAAILTPDAYLAPGYQRKQIEAAGFILAKLHAQGIDFIPPEDIVTPPWSFYFQTWLYHMTGATPLLFEFCHGLTMRPHSLEAILETGFAMFEAWLDYCLLFGARPKSQEFFAPVRPA